MSLIKLDVSLDTTSLRIRVLLQPSVWGSQLRPPYTPDDGAGGPPRNIYWKIVTTKFRW